LHKKILVTIILLIQLCLAENDNLPNRIILNLTENPSTEMAITWRTTIAVENPLAIITKATSKTKFDTGLIELIPTTEKTILDNGKVAHYYSAIFKNIKPGTIYAYKVGEAGNWSEWNQFTTASVESKAFEFIYFGDIQNGIYTMSPRVLRSAFKKSPNAGFCFFAGDMVNHQESDEEWGQIFDGLGWATRTTPMIMLPGNHDYPSKKSGLEHKISNIWRPQFTLPENGIPGLEETSYFIDYQGVKFITLNGNEKLEEQAKWLDEILSVNTQKWVIASIHQPIYAVAKGRNNPKYRDTFLPVIDKYSIDLVLQGHDHAYARTHKLRNNEIVKDSEVGTIYVVSVVGINSYTPNEETSKFMAKMDTGNQLFQVIKVDENKLTFTSYTALGELYDSFEIVK